MLNKLKSNWAVTDLLLDIWKWLDDQVGENDGLASLDANGELRAAQAPSHTTLSDIGNNSHSDIDTFINSKGSANGLASLDADGVLKAAQAPSHTALSDIGNNSHSDIDTFINSKGSADGLASLNASGVLKATQAPSHTALSDIGNNTHSDIDSFINSKGSADGLASLNTDGKVPTAQLPNSILEYKGTWNADTNDPALSDGDSTNAGNVYRVSVAGTTDFGSGSISFKVADYCIADENGTWEKADTTDAVSSINGYTGDVTLDTDDVSEGTTNLYYTDERVDDRVSNLLSNAGNVSLAYDDANNVLNISVPDDLTVMSNYSTDDLSEGSTNKYNVNGNWSQTDDAQSDYVKHKPTLDFAVGYEMT